MSQKVPQVLVITGPTASGKSALALGVADLRPAVIIGADSMQIYRGLDVGTAKACAADRARHPHVLIDLVDVDEDFNITDYVPRAQAAIAEALGQDRLPIVCGGSGQYIEALILGEAFEDLPYDPKLRRQLQRRLTDEGLPALVAQLNTLDPARAARIDRHNPRRVVRALELAISGGPDSGSRPAQRSADPRYDWRLLILDPEREKLDRRIAERIDAMFEAGLVEEAKELLERPLRADATCLQAIGYKELFPWLRGEQTEAEAREALRIATRRYAKRQRTWFRRYDAIAGLNPWRVSAPPTPSAIIDWLTDPR